MKMLLAVAAAMNLFAAHPEAKSEWWYYTGHLAGAGGRRYGFELTFFRALLPDGEDLDAAHFALTDIDRRTFRYDEKLHRPFPGIAGGDATRLRVFSENWEARRENGRHVLQARMRGAAISLVLAPRKLPVLNGRDGISRKGPRADEYSHYVTIPRLEVRGTLALDSRQEPVAGTAWFDHEWGPGGLPQRLAGWDWFALQLSDGGEVMLYRLRDTDGTISPFSSGTWIAPDGTSRTLGAGDFRVQPTATWSSPRTGATYPAGWRITVASLRLTATVTPEVADQELVTAKSTRVTYWEGACSVSGTHEGRDISGESYVELTGYAGRDLP